MEYYHALRNSTGTHTIQVTFQYKQYVGSLTYRVGGNCKGLTLLSDNPLEEFGPDDFDALQTENMKLRYDEYADVFMVIFNPDSPNSLEMELEPREVEQLIVKVEIIDFQEDA